jgi:CRISPR-associated protein Cmr6
MITPRLPIPVERLRRAHAGLLFDKYFDERSASAREQPKTRLCKTLAALRLANPAYKLAFRRWRALFEPPPPHRLILEGRVLGRLALGLGAENVTENGLRLHHAYGTPLIPASSLKGVLRDAVPNTPKRYQDFLFGPAPDPSGARIEEKQGAAVFYDAWWVPNSSPGLALDIVTVHHQPYYHKKAPPTDFDMPIPVNFLTFTGSFLFILDSPNPAWRDYLARLLRHVLSRDGIGAKRSAGYGRFAFPS